MAKELNCPSCGPDHKLIRKTNGDVVCGNCNTTFELGTEPKVVAIGEYEALKGRLAKVEADYAKLNELVAAGKPVPDASFAAAEIAEECEEEDEDI